MRYEVHLPSLYLCDGENSQYILEWAVLPTLHNHVLSKNWHLCEVCWEDCKHKNLAQMPVLAKNVTVQGGEDRPF